MGLSCGCQPESSPAQPTSEEVRPLARSALELEIYDVRDLLAEAEAERWACPSLDLGSEPRSAPGPNPELNQDQLLERFWEVVGDLGRGSEASLELHRGQLIASLPPDAQSLVKAFLRSTRQDLGRWVDLRPTLVEAGALALALPSYAGGALTLTPR